MLQTAYNFRRGENLSESVNLKVGAFGFALPIFTDSGRG